MGNEVFNGKTQEIHENVLAVRTKLSTLESSIEKLSRSTDNLASAVTAQSASSDKLFTHMTQAIPAKLVVLICFIICLAFVGGGVMKELVDSHVLIKLFGL